MISLAGEDLTQKLLKKYKFFYVWPLEILFDRANTLSGTDRHTHSFLYKLLLFC